MESEAVMFPFISSHLLITRTLFVFLWRFELSGANCVYCTRNKRRLGRSVTLFRWTAFHQPYCILTFSFSLSFWQIFRSPLCDHPPVLYPFRISWSGPLLFRTHWHSCRKTPDPWWARYLVDRGCDSADHGKASTRRWKQLGAILLKNKATTKSSEKFVPASLHKQLQSCIKGLLVKGKYMNRRPTYVQCNVSYTAKAEITEAVGVLHLMNLVKE